MTRCVSRSRRLVANAGDQFRRGIGLKATATQEAGRDRLDIARIPTVARRPFLRHLVEADVAAEAGSPTVQHLPGLHLARAVGSRVRDANACINEEVFQVGAHAFRHRWEALARNTAAGCADACEVVLTGADVTAVSEEACFDEHLVERIIPTHPKLVSDPHIVNCDVGEFAGKAWIAITHIRHHAAWCGTRRRRVVR